MCYNPKKQQPKVTTQSHGGSDRTLLVSGGSDAASPMLLIAFIFIIVCIFLGIRKNSDTPGNGKCPGLHWGEGLRKRSWYMNW